MNTRIRMNALLAGALGAVLLSSTVYAGEMSVKFEEKSRGRAERHTQSRQPAGRQSAPRERAATNNGNGYGRGQPNQGNGPGSGQHRGNDGGRSSSTPPRGVPGQHNGSDRQPGHVDARPLPPRSGTGNAWNRHSGNRGYVDRPGTIHRPPRVVPSLPAGHRHYSWNGGAYYQHAGLWYRPYGTRYVVVGAPYGLSVSYLPSYYSSFWFGGLHYFHADSTYYLYEPAHRTYVVTQSPYESDNHEQGSSGNQGEDLYIYPAQGQSEQQQADDRYECHRWAVDETGYDPTESDYDADRRVEHLRAMTACLTGRGYSVR